MYHSPKERFERIFDDNYRRLYAHALRFVQNEEDAEDIVADVFYEFWKRIDEIDLESGIVTYLYRAVATRALNLLRHRNISPIRLETLKVISDRRLEFIANDDIYDIVTSKELNEAIRGALSELPEKCRQVFVLSYINGLKSKDIAEVMNISVRTVEAHIYKALKLLRNRLQHLVRHT